MMKTVPSPNQAPGGDGSDVVFGIGSSSSGGGGMMKSSGSRSGGLWLGGYLVPPPPVGSLPLRDGGPVSPPTHGSRRGSAIADDIRNDRELFFASDEDDDGPASAAAAMMDDPQRMMICDDHDDEEPAMTTMRRSTSSSVGLVRRTSQQKMKNLQREVDLALEYFSQENEVGLDDHLVDGDDYLTNHRHHDHHASRPRAEKKYRRASGGGGGAAGECDSCCGGGGTATGTAATSMATSVVTDYDNNNNNNNNNEFGDCHFVKFLSLSSEHSSSPGASMDDPAGGPSPTGAGNSLSLKHKAKSLVTLPKSLLPSQTALNCAMEEDDASMIGFENVISEELEKLLRASGGGECDKNRIVDFNLNMSLRNAMEPFLAVARIRREKARQAVFDTLDRVILPQEPHAIASRRVSTSNEFSFPIGSSYGVPYPTLRNESSFLYDVDSFPLESILAETLGVEDLSKLHLDHPLKKDKGRLLATLQNRGRRRSFHRCFDSFVTSQVIPLLHSQALSGGVFYTNRHQLQRGRAQSIVYRYQAFPTINIVRPGECSTDPHCDMAQGHSIGNISYHIPLTATFGTNALYAESRPGREDWHPLAARSPGLGFRYDGARCLHFNLKNETNVTRVSLNFRIAIVRAPEVSTVHGGREVIEYDPDDQLCCPELLGDEFSRDNPGFYDEVVVNVGDVPRSFMPGPIAVKRRGGISVVG
eukprot:CAMPEP_0181099540 /NCGR_PEP_ID=MMETSP1071-20121207/12713_1 /TAXON_ID=35127 /ORGANISM="Thalassiosira sp., Strain NH16" /LENGTH=701 /DNA_ID=CAMNT_0023182207 /DNA_START=102 /DNA_END=2207 /DNA_ORIENTATION=+